MSSFLERVVRFVAVAEELSFTKAAARLSVDQPWLSRQIAQLESTLRFKLIERTPRGILLTESGEQFLQSARTLAEAAKRATADGARLERGRGMLIVGLTAYSFWVPQRQALLDSFRHANPDVNLVIRSKPIPEMLRDLEEGELDLAIIGQLPESSEFENRTLYQGSVGILIPKDDPLATKEALHVADLTGRRLAVVDSARSGKVIYRPFIEAGMIPCDIPEGRMAMSYYAERERLCVLTWNQDEPEIGFSADMVHRQVVDAPPAVVFNLIRMRGDTRYLVERAWAIAGHVAGG